MRDDRRRWSYPDSAVESSGRTPSGRGTVTTARVQRQSIMIATSLALCSLALAACGGGGAGSSAGSGAPPASSSTSRPSTTAAAPLAVGSWSNGVQVSATDLLESISCVSSSFCMATGDGDNGDGPGSVFTYSNGTWSNGVQLAATDPAGVISCANVSFCVALGENGSVDQPRSYSFTYTDGSWSSEQPLSTAFAAYSVSCPSAAFCVAVGPGPTKFDRRRPRHLYQRGMVLS